MSGMTWFKCYPRDFNDGMVGLTLEERGAYITVLNVIYARGGPVPDDSGYFRALLCCSAKTWSKIRAALIVKRKLFEVSHNAEPCLMNARAADIIADNLRISEKFSEAGKRGGSKPRAKSNKNNDIGEAQAKPRSSILDTDTDKIPLDKSNGAEVLSIEALDKATWEAAEKVLTLQGGMSQRSAKSFFGRLLSEHKLRARDMASAVADCIGAGTSDPQGYLTGSARRFSRKQAEAAPQKRVTWC